MHFDTALYGWFLVIVVSVYWLIARFDRARMLWLLAVSLFFYGSWNATYLWLILFSAMVDYLVGARIHRSEDPVVRKRWLLVSLCSNLGLVSVFKYLGFFSTIFNDLQAFFSTGIAVPIVHLVLPVGLMFYTFQTLSYTIDIYRKTLTPVDSFTKFLLFVSFFPQLVAGPIVRASEFLPQLESPPRYRSEDVVKGLSLIAVGIFKKVVIANSLSINFVDRIFENPSFYSSGEVILGVYGYAMQIYCDFSGYTDVAIGSALLLGFTLPENFRRPYTALNLQAFWRKWHISLSSWLRDYLYIPLGGNRHGAWNTYRNLMITMILGGLWHGASWNFVIWGLLHGAGLAVNRMFQRNFAKGKAFFESPPRWYRVVSGLVTFHFVCLAWIFFRSQDLSTVMAIFDSIATWTFDLPNVTLMIALILIGSYAAHFVPFSVTDRLMERFAQLPSWVQALVFVALVVLVSRVKGMDVVPFIYFQF